jgi:hypothetical protein
MADSGIRRLDDLLKGIGDPLTPENSGSAPEAVGAIQDLLRGHGFKAAGLRVPGYGKFGPSMAKALAAFQKSVGLTQRPAVDRATASKLVTRPAANPIVSRPYMTLVLDEAFDGLAKIVSLVAIVEGAGRFSAMCLNTDQAGLSVGIIQWAQKPKRLRELVVDVWDQEAKAVLRPLLGMKVDDDAEFNKLAAHLNKVRGGTRGKRSSAGDPAPGETTDPAFDLIREPWTGRFRKALLNRRLQALQLKAAIKAFAKSRDNINNHMPKLTSELAVAFTIDLANQFGDPGARKIYDKAVAAIPNGTERQILEKMRDISVERLTTLFPKQPQIAEAGKARRNFFLNESGLSNGLV